jgi:hypothetical protein
VSADKTDKDRSYVKKYHCHEPIPVPFEIKNKTVVSNIISSTKTLLYFSQIAPISLLGFLVPFRPKSLQLPDGFVQTG